MAAAEEPRFRVISSEAVRANLRDIIRAAKEAGRGPEAIAALEQIHRRLQQNPFGFGEPLFHLRRPGAELRTAMLSPIVVCFGVYPAEQLVVIFWFRLSG